ncbi:MAG TPA: MaoC family dehydratase N-terminal domain-containing protein [Brevibacterium senegalense]|uniref:MaoC family dehydratase N-terminal domain-containing protein n=1 Tax=Brevibacterium senegalense TaxID=1033736 RepID=A0A921MH97_9MICO|nr:MaoC family dehydratase N-terminal domain-containing protein [Brevibacterium senegalense]
MTAPEQPHAPADRLPAEQIPVGVEVELGSHTVTEEEVLAFGRDWDPQYFHVDEDAARESDFGGLIASGIHTLAVYQRLSVTQVLTGYDIVAGRQLREVRFLRPVRPGDTLTGSMRVERIDPAVNGRAMGVSSGQLVNQHGKQVLTLDVDFVIRSETSPGRQSRP